MNTSAFRGRGLCGRFLYGVCKGNIGFRKVSPEPIPQAVRNAYHTFIRSLIDTTDTGTITLSKEADRLRCEFQETVERRLGNEWEAIRDWAGKLVGAVCRIAGIIHCGTADHPADSSISPEAFEAAVKVGEFLGCHAEAAFGMMGASKTEEDAKYILKRIQSMTRITRTDLTRACRGRFKRAEAMEAALAVLEERNYIRRGEDPVGYKNRVTVYYTIHPELW